MNNKSSSKCLEPYSVKVEKGKKYAWSSCSLSVKQPFCDGAHSSTELKPIIFIADTSGIVYLCGCKYTKKPPYCDGSHSSL